MSVSLPKALPTSPRKMLSARLPTGETVGKKVSDDALRAFAGRLIAAAFQYSGLTPQQATGEMGYANQTPISKWSSGLDLPSMVVRLLSVQELRTGLLLALAREAGDDVEVNTVVTVRRRSEVA